MTTAEPPLRRAGVFYCLRTAGGWGVEELAVLLLRDFTLCCMFHPISLVLPKETGWSPKEKRFWVVAPP